MFRVDDRTTCMDYPGAKRSEHVTDIAWKPANKQLVRLTREFALKTRMQRSYLPGENSLLSFLVPKLIGRCDQSEKKETKQGVCANMCRPGLNGSTRRMFCSRMAY